VFVHLLFFSMFLFSAGSAINACKILLKFASYEEFWRFCFGQCQDFKVGCAVDCELRKQLVILSHGKSYEGKLEGEIKSDA